MAADSVTFTTSTGARVTAPVEVAKRMGWKEPAAEKPAPRAKKN